jgi:SagB-type dehydrogenase family enzyme
VQAELKLPPPKTRGTLSLERALAERRSVREFTDASLTIAEISQLFWAAQGVTRDWGGRTAPSAGALYPLELYAVTPKRFLHYVPDEHTAMVVSRADLRRPLARAAFGQSAVEEAPAVFVIAAVTSRTAAKYGPRAERYVTLEAGHAAQNLLLQAVALHLGAVPVGAFSDEGVSEALGLPADHEPLYLVPVGHPAE